jgi:galactose mutarotase-like enzyme
VRWRNWEVRARDAARVVMGHVLYGESGYPFMLALEIEYALEASGLTITTSALNIGPESCPYGAGMHPYFTLGVSLIDEAVLTVPAATRLLTDERGIPVGEEPVAEGPLDFRAPREIGTAQIDDCFTGLDRDEDGKLRVRLSSPDGARKVTVWCSPEYEYVMVFTGDTLAEEHRRRGVAIEPMTCAPDALRTGAGLARLEPGEQHVASWGIEPAEAAQGA